MPDFASECHSCLPEPEVPIGQSWMRALGGQCSQASPQPPGAMLAVPPPLRRAGRWIKGNSLGAFPFQKSTPLRHNKELRPPVVPHHRPRRRVDPKSEAPFPFPFPALPQGLRALRAGCGASNLAGMLASMAGAGSLGRRPGPSSLPGQRKRAAARRAWSCEAKPRRLVLNGQLLARRASPLQLRRSGAAAPAPQPAAAAAAAVMATTGSPSPSPDKPGSLAHD